MITYTVEGDELVIRIPLKLGEKVLDTQQSNAIENLTPKEREVFAGTVRGLQAKELAGQFNCSVRAVKFHLTNIYRKMKVYGKQELQTKYYKGELK